MRATEEGPARFKSMPDDAAAAMSALRRQFMDGAFEAIEIMGDAVDHHFQRLVVFIAAAFTRRAAVTISIRRRLFLPILPGLWGCLTLNHIPSVKPQATPPIGQIPQNSIS